MEIFDNCKWKKKIRIRQVTPMIHFQPEQQGATLRATELKPKLDRFLIQLSKVREELLKQNGFENEINVLHAIAMREKQFFIENDNPDVNALKYKVRIGPEGESKKHIMPVRDPADRKKGYGAFFPIDDVKKDSSFYDYVLIEFVSLNQELLQLIFNAFPIFLSATSFGFRQNKGFGHFMIECSETEQIAYGKKFVSLFSDTFHLYLAEYDSPVDYKSILDNICKMNEDIKKSLDFRKDVEEQKGKKPNNKKQIDKMINCCDKCLNNCTQEVITDVFPDAKPYTERNNKRRIVGLQDIGILYGGSVSSNNKVTLGNDYTVYDASVDVTDVYWRKGLEDRGESPMYFIPVLYGERLQYRKVMIILNCDRLNDIQMELYAKVKVSLQKNEEDKKDARKNTKKTTKEGVKEIPMNDYPGLLESIFHEILCDKQVGRMKISACS